MGAWVFFFSLWISCHFLLFGRCKTDVRRVRERGMPRVWWKGGHALPWNGDPLHPLLAKTLFRGRILYNAGSERSGVREREYIVPWRSSRSYWMGYLTSSANLQLNYHASCQTNGNQQATPPSLLPRRTITTSAALTSGRRRRNQCNSCNHDRQEGKVFRPFWRYQVLLFSFWCVCML